MSTRLQERENRDRERGDLGIEGGKKIGNRYGSNGEIEDTALEGEW